MFPPKPNEPFRDNISYPSGNGAKFEVISVWFVCFWMFGFLNVMELPALSFGVMGAILVIIGIILSVFVCFLWDHLICYTKIQVVFFVDIVILLCLWDEYLKLEHIVLRMLCMLCMHAYLQILLY